VVEQSGHRLGARRSLDTKSHDYEFYKLGNNEIGRPGFMKLFILLFHSDYLHKPTKLTLNWCS
jgi:hypothetical protein